MSRRKYTNASEHTTSTQYTTHSADSYGSLSTAPSSLHGSSRPSTKGSLSQKSRFQSPCQEDDLSPSTSLCPRSSVDTYSSLASSEDLADSDSEGDLDFDESSIPPLPTYRHEIEEFNVQPSTPDDFAALFPSLDRLSIRHDDFTSDGNMNLRVDTVVPGRRKKTIQLFHLRMYDLNKRDFSLRRYCRDSGREVCNSKRKYIDPSSPSRPTIQRSMSNAFQSIAGRPKLRRLSTAGSIRSNRSRPGTSYSTAETVEDELVDTFEHDMILEKKHKARLQPTNAIKLEFSNYARVDVERTGNKNSKKYQFEWWGQKYSWKRVVDKHTNAVSFHLLKNGDKTTPVAHIVPETRSPNQVAVDEHAGGWVPPCHMWISDQSLVDAMTDVADVVIATGLMALVDDCIKGRWQNKKASRLVDADITRPKSFVQHLFSRRNSDNTPSPLRVNHPVEAA